MIEFMNKVLVVDDEEDIGIMMRAMLKSLGYKVDYAGNLSDATEKLENERFKVVFLDLNLDNEYGLNLVSTIRKTNRDANIVVITAQKGLDVKKDVALNDIDSLIQKPFNKSQIVSILENQGAE